MVERFPVDESADALWHDYRQRMPQLVRPFDGVMDALAELRGQGWRICIVTNGMVDNQTGKLRSSGLDAMVDAWCISEEVGHRKPTAEFFSAVSERMARHTEEPTWIVGDDPVDDIDGGRAVGASTIWVSRGQPWPPHLVPPTLTTNTPAEALQELGQQAN